MPSECKNMLFERMQAIHEAEKFDTSLRVSAGSVLIAFCDQSEEDIRFLQRAILFALHEYGKCASMRGLEDARKETVLRAPLAVRCLKQLVKIDGAFEKKFIDMLSQLVGTNDQPSEVLSALGEVFGVKVAPLINPTEDGEIHLVLVFTIVFILRVNIKKIYDVQFYTNILCPFFPLLLIRARAGFNV